MRLPPPPSPSPAPAALATQVQGPARPGYSAPPPRNVGLQTPTISWASHLPGGEGWQLSQSTTTVSPGKGKINCNLLIGRLGIII